ncbi:MAG: TonB family protein [Acidobacteria bacterium]|nr:TonB family protein [Acidobacteriota bacterium]
MYFEIDESHPDITPVGSVMSWREGVLLSIIIHLVFALLAVTAPDWLAKLDVLSAKPQQVPMQQKPENERTQFVFVQPRLDMRAQRPRERAEASDQDRQAASPRQNPQQQNPLPFSQGNTRERVERSESQVARGQGPTPEPMTGQQSPSQTQQAPQMAENELRLPEAQSPLQIPSSQPPSPRSGAQGRAQQQGGSLGDALRNLQRYVQRDNFDNAQGGGAFGPAIQFDTKGVEFGPWVRRFVAQVKRNWMIPYAAMSMRGRVVVTFNVHKDGSITDLQVVGPSPVEAFNNAAYGALAASNPTAPLPPEYPSDKAFFTVTFFYNEEPQ